MTSAPVAAKGPAFVTEIDHETGAPSAAVGPPERLTARSAACRHSTAPASQRGPYGRASRAGRWSAGGTRSSRLRSRGCRERGDVARPPVVGERPELRSAKVTPAAHSLSLPSQALMAGYCRLKPPFPSVPEQFLPMFQL